MKKWMNNILMLFFVSFFSVTRFKKNIFAHGPHFFLFLWTLPAYKLYPFCLILHLLGEEIRVHTRSASGSNRMSWQVGERVNLTGP